MMTFAEAFAAVMEGCPKCNRLNLFKAQWSGGCKDKTFSDNSHIERLTWVCGCGFSFVSYPFDAKTPTA